MIGRKVNDDGEGDTRVCRHVLEECFVGLKAAGRSTDRGDQKLRCVALAHGLYTFGRVAAGPHECLWYARYSVLPFPVHRIPPTDTASVTHYVRLKMRARAIQQLFFRTISRSCLSSLRYRVS